MNEQIKKACELTEKYRSYAIAISAPIVFSREDSVAGLRLRASDLASVGHRRLLVAADDCTDSRLSEAVAALLTIERKKSHIRRVDVCISGEVTRDALAALADSGAATVAFSLASGGHKLAREVGIADIGLEFCFTSDCETELESLITAARELGEDGPREFILRRDTDVSAELFAELAARVRGEFPFAGITVKANELRSSDISSDTVGSLLGIATTLLTGNTTESLDGTVSRLLGLGQFPSFCTSCSREGRVGCEYAAACKNGSMRSFCFLNAILSFKEYLSDFGSQDTRVLGTDRIFKELYTIKNDEVRKLVVGAIKDMRNGARDLRF